jgi:hypothetical protein
MTRASFFFFLLTHRALNVTIPGNVNHGGGYTVDVSRMLMQCVCQTWRKPSRREKARVRQVRESAQRFTIARGLRRVKGW